MPGMDGTGPRGKGQRTGWGAGRCGPPKKKEQGDDALEAAPVAEDDDTQSGWGRGFGRRFRNRGGGGGGGGGRGRGQGQGQGQGQGPRAADTGDSTEKTD